MKDFLLRKLPPGKRGSGSFFQYLLYFVMMAVIVIIICIFSMQGYLHNIISNHLLEINKNALVHIKSSHDVLLDEINNSLTNIIFDTEFQEFPKNNSTYSKYELIRKLETISTSNVVFSEIFLYYPEINTVVSTDEGVVTLDNSVDKDFILSITSTGGNHRYSQFRVRNNKYQSQVISMLKSIPLGSQNPIAYVVFDIDASYVSELLSSLNVSESMFLIMDRYGNHISKDNISPEILQDIFSEYSTDSINVEPIVYERDFQGEKMYISTTFSEKYQWTYFSILPFSVIENQYNMTKGFIIFLFVVVLLTAIILSYFLSARAHAPIRVIAQKLNAGDSKAPLHAITENVENILNENNNLTKMLSDYNLHLEKTFLSDLLFGRVDDLQTAESRLGYYKMRFSADDYFMSYTMKLKTAGEDTEYSKSTSILTLYITNLIQEQLLCTHPGFFIQSGNDEYTLVVSFGNSDNAERGHALASRLHRIVTDSSDYAFSIGVSNLHQGIISLPTAYKESRFALYSNRVVAYANITLYCNVSGHNEVIEYPYPIEESLTTAIVAGNQHDTYAAIEHLRSYLAENCSPHTQNIRTFYLQLLAAFSKCLNEMDFSSESLSQKEASLYNMVLYEKITEEIFIDMLKGLADEILSLEDNIHSNRNQPILEALKKFIREHLDEDLSTERLAKNFYVSPSYLRKLFKDVYAITLKTYIDNERIKRAKELLCDPKVKQSDIPEKIGYLSSQSFTRAFKQHTGKTPGEYRSEHLQIEQKTTDV